jgi:hypothetical protein
MPYKININYHNNGAMYASPPTKAYMLALTNIKGGIMSIVIVGGNDRMATRYQDICKSFNHKSKVFTQMPADFENKLGTPDLMVVFTGTCSHKMLGAVKKSSEKNGVPVEHVHSSSVSALKQLLTDIKGRKYVRS